MNAEVLAELAAELDLGPALLLGKGEDASGGRAKPSILADAMEAVIAAVYLDGGMDAARDLVLRLLGERIRDGPPGPGGDDYKTRLQELAAQRFDQLPRYQVRARRPRPLEAVLRDGARSAARCTARAKAGRRSRPSRRRHATRGRGCRARHERPPPTGGDRSG